MNCCVAGTNGCLDLRRRAFALDGQVSAEWSGCPGSMARRVDTVGIATKLSRLDACEDLEGCPLVKEAGIQLQFVVDSEINKACVSTAAPDRSAVVCG